MITNWYLLSTKILLIVCLLSLNSNAQVNSEVLTPFNKEGITRAIFTSYSYYLNIPEEVLKNFIYSSQEENVYNSEIAPPNPAIFTQNNESVTFNWPYIPLNATLRIRYLNFNNGMQGEVLLNNQNSIQLPTINHHKYLFLFSFLVKEKEGIVKSGDYIIIEENPIIRQPVFTTCDCSDPKVIVPETDFLDIEQNQNNILLDNSLLEVGVQYKVQFRSTASEGFYYLTRRKGKTPLIYEVSIKEECVKNVRLPQNEFLFYGVNPGAETNAYLGFSVGQGVGLRLNWLDHNVPGTISVIECASGGGERAAKQESIFGDSDVTAILNLENFPNPSTGKSTLRYRLDNSRTVSIFLSNSRGEIIYFLKNNDWQVPGIYNMEIDLSSFPNGMYQCHLQINGEMESIRFLKLE